MSGATFDSTFTGVFGGPCPSCGGSGQLFRHYGEHGGQRTLIHATEDGSEQSCSLPETAGTVYTAAGRWWYEAGPKPDPSAAQRLAELEERIRKVRELCEQADARTWEEGHGYVDSDLVRAALDREDEERADG